MGPALALLCMLGMHALALTANRSFDIIYINLERNKDRRKHIEKMLLHAGCSFSRFCAVDGLELCSRRRSILDYTGGVSIMPTDSDIQQRINTRNAGRAGCHLSHLIVLRHIEVSDTDRPVLVLEDDIDLDEHFVSKVEDVVADPPAGWNVVLLGGIASAKWWKRRHSRYLLEVRYEACLHAYLLNGARSARRVADAIDTRRCPGRPVDLIIGDAFLDDNSFVFFCFCPMIAVQRRDLFESDITMSHTPFYMRCIQSLFPRAYNRSLKRSLSHAAASAKDVAKTAPSLPASPGTFVMLAIITILLL